MDSNLTVLTFDNETGAGEVLETIRRLEHAHQIDIRDSAAIVRRQDGKIELDQRVSSATKVGVAGGGVLGMLLFFMFPVAGFAGGAAVGGWLASKAGRGVDRAFVNDVTAALQPGTSALFLETAHGNAPVVLNALREHRGKVYHTTLSSEAEEQLRAALHDRG
jgi:uncharacterized membrane protein